MSWFNKSQNPSQHITASIIPAQELRFGLKGIYVFLIKSLMTPCTIQTTLAIPNNKLIAELLLGFCILITKTIVNQIPTINNTAPMFGTYGHFLFTCMVLTSFLCLVYQYLDELSNPQIRFEPSSIPPQIRGQKSVCRREELNLHPCCQG